jgi:signal peptidase II
MFLLGVSLLVVVLDQVTKFLVARSFTLNQSRAVLPGWLNLTYIHNPGAAFGFMSDMEALVRIPFFVAVTVAAGFMVYAYHRLIPPEKGFARFSLGLIWGGALGNFVDRILYGKVIDFLEFKFIQFPVFNVADSCISVGLALLVLEYLIGRFQKPQAA